MRKLLLSFVALIGLSTAAALGNYAMTQGSGTTFGSTVVGGIHYVQMFLCDLTTPAQCAAVSAGGAVKVDGSAVTQPVSGTVTANVGTGTRPISIASGQVASGSFSSGAFASGSYASGAFAAGSMVDLLTVIGTKNNGTAATNSLLAGGIYNSTPITMSNGQGAALQFDANGYLKVNTAAGAAAGGTSSNFGSAFPTPGTATGFTDGTNMVAGRVGAVANVAAATNFLNSLGICQYLATPPTITDTRFNQIQCDVNGNIKVTVSNTNANGQATMANSSPVTIASNQSANALWGHGATGASVPANATYMGFNSGGNLTGPAVATPLPVRQSDGTNVAALDPCQTEAPTYTPINISASGAAKIITGVSAKKVYFCHIHLVTNAANNVALVEGTGTNCGTSKVAIIGGTTAASGWNFSANGGISLGMGVSSVMAASVNADDICLDPSASTQLSGHVKWVAR